MNILNILFYYLAIGLLNSNCSLNEDFYHWENSRNKIFVDFKLNETQVDIKNKFKIIFYFGNQTRHAKIIGNQIRLPKFPLGAKSTDVVFIFNEYRLKFKNIKLDRLSLDQDMSWVFIKKNKPFQDDGFENIDLNKLKEIHYWQFIPLEKGEGVELMEPIY